VSVPADLRAGLLGDTSGRDYSRKLLLFNRFAEPELRRAIAGLDLSAGMRILDAGCGTGQSLEWFREESGDDGLVVGMDLAAAHAAAARAAAPPHIAVLQADLQRAPFAPGSFDLIWSVNTINHLREPLQGLKQLRTLLRPAGRLALAQSSFVPDMYFAWDARLERLVNEAMRCYYRDRYGLNERDLTAVRALVGWLRSAQLQQISVHTYVIERLAPLSTRDEAYLVETLFRDTWGERLRPYLSADDCEQLARLCDPDDDNYALRRPEFHFIQTLTLAAGAR
jgi:SAM-dependent methyltransferase